MVTIPRSLILLVVIVVIVIVIAAAAITLQHPGKTGATPGNTASTTTTRPGGTQATSPTSPSTTSLKPNQTIIILEVPDNEALIKYTQLNTYTKENYREINREWDKYSTMMKEEIEEAYSKGGAHIVDFQLLKMDYNNSILIKFTVDNKVWVSGNSVTADFLWFLNAWNLDFINSGFSESPDGLYWKGEINGTSVTILVHVPHQPGPYKAWGEPYGHCHGHIWWPKT